MTKYIFTEEQIKKVIDKVILEQKQINSKKTEVKKPCKSCQKSR